MWNVLLADTVRGIYFPTLWRNVKRISGDGITLGFCVGAFSLGRTILNPVLGKISADHGYRSALLVACTLVMLGAVLYAAAGTIVELILGQFIMGSGAGTLGITRAYVVDKGTELQRTALLACTVSMQYAGFACMPLLGGYLSYVLGDRVIPVVGKIIVLNEFTAPSFALVGAGILSMILLCFIFKDDVERQEKSVLPDNGAEAISRDDEQASQPPQTPQQAQPSQHPQTPKQAQPSQQARTPQPQTATEWYSLYFRYSRGDGHQQQPQQKRPLEEEGYENVDLNGRSQSITTVATRPSSFWSPQTQVSVSANEGRFFLAGEGLSDVSLATTDGFGSISDHVSGDNNARISSWIRCGLIGRVVQNLRKKFNMSGLAKHLLLGAFMLGVATQGTISCFETLGAEYAMTKFDLTSAETGSIFATCGAVGVLVAFSTGILSRNWNGVELIIGGVALMTVTCLVLVSSLTGASGLRVFQGAVFLTYSVGYPAGHTAIISLFSKLVDLQPQDGLYGSAGALARICFPVMAGVVAEELSSSLLFALLALILATTAGILFVHRKSYMECYMQPRTSLF